MGDGAMVPLVIFKKGLSVYSISCFAILNRFIHAIYIYVSWHSRSNNLVANTIVVSPYVTRRYAFGKFMLIL